MCAAHGAGYDWIRDRGRMVPPLPGSADSLALSLVRAAADEVDGVTIALQQGHATLEANYLAAWTDVVAVASGGRDPHQTSESITVAELDQLQALLERIVELAGAAARDRAARQCAAPSSRAGIANGDGRPVRCSWASARRSS